MMFTVATYNVLAFEYIRPDWYPFTPAGLLDVRHRLPALVQHVAGLGADVCCLQEVEADTFAALDRALSTLGYHGERVAKGSSRPDGCAMFFNTRRFRQTGSRRLEYDDGLEGRPSGHVAQIVILGTGRSRLLVANTHLKWDPPDTPLEQQYGYRQICQLLSACAPDDDRSSARIICGDLNATPDSAVLRALADAGFHWTHAGIAGVASCNSNQETKLIDFLLHDAALSARPEPLLSLTDTTPLPGPAQPSDHLAVMARFDWT